MTNKMQNHTINLKLVEWTEDSDDVGFLEMLFQDELLDGKNAEDVYYDKRFLLVKILEKIFREGV